MGLKNLLSTLVSHTEVVLDVTRVTKRDLVAAVDFAILIHGFINTKTNETITEYIDGRIPVMWTLDLYIDRHQPICAKIPLIEKRISNGTKALIRECTSLLNYPVTAIDDDLIATIKKGGRKYSKLYDRILFSTDRAWKRKFVDNLVHELQRSARIANIMYTDTEAEIEMAKRIDSYDVVISEDQDLIMVGLYTTTLSNINIFIRGSVHVIPVNRHTLNLSLVILLAHGNDFVDGINYLTIRPNTVQTVLNYPNPLVNQDGFINTEYLLELLLLIYLQHGLNHIPLCLEKNNSIQIIEYYNLYIQCKNIYDVPRPPKSTLVDLISALMLNRI